MFMWYQHLDFLTALLGAISTITTIGLYAPSIMTMNPVEDFLLIIVITIGQVSAVLVLVGAVIAIVQRRTSDRQSGSRSSVYRKTDDRGP
jgi:Trk-type K+ transport system membrane component